LDNALKHSAGDIDVNAKRKGSLIQIHVQDVGEGIAPQELEHIFDRFYRGDQTTAVQGFGLGLPIAKSLVERQAGTIKMESELGKGSTLIIDFPGISQEYL
jgi:signal transduction histidine kinase